MVSTEVSISGYRISEQLYDGSRTVVYRGYRETDSIPVVIKLLKNPYPSFTELLQFRNQYTIAKNLNLSGIIQTYSLEPYQNGYALVMEDFGGISLKEWTRGKLPTLIEFLQIAIALCNILDILIRHRVIHKDIKPANILINPETGEVKLIDFSIASLLPRETQTLMSPNVLEGTLGYLSPEQTGRMNRGIDYRTDFYSLGVTFYELLTGQLPFQSNDSMELVHCHIVKQPPKVHSLNPAIGSILSDIVSKLMAKNAEDRYQSALGLKHDLETCLAQLQQTGKIESFPLRQRDVCDRFIIPEKLYGRENEVQTLLKAFDRVTKNQTELMLVAGFSGIGKTAIVNEVHKPIVEERGYFIKGKFDQFNRNIPLSAFVQAFRDLMEQLLSESDSELLTWQNQILAALGDNGQVIIEVIPELAQIIGQQPLALELSGTAAQNRFNLLFQKFIQVFTTKEHPLVIFLDDLQWADSASLKLMQLLMSESEVGHLLLIGAYRDHEVWAAHPLMLTLEEIGKTKATINTITLEPLSEASLNQLVADTLTCSLEVAKPLTQLVYQKTKGNPFFSTQFLKALHEDRLMQFDLDAGNWQCDIAEVKALALTDDVVEFMALQLQKLPNATQNVLKLAACIGNQFDLMTLAIVSEKSETETATALWKALQEGLILPQSEVYKFYQDGNGSLLTVDCEQLTVNRQPSTNYKFLHDRVQQAAYSLIPQEDKKLTNLKIGQLLLRNTPVEEREEKIFAIVNQLNIGRELINNQTQRLELADLNLIAGKKAKAANAYAAAVEYSTVGRELLEVDSWESNYKLTLALFELTVEAAYLSGNFQQMERAIEVVLQRAKTLLDKIKVYEVKITACGGQNQLFEAIKTTLEVLHLLGVSFPEQPSPLDIQKGLEEVTSSLSGKQIEHLIDLQTMTDPIRLATMRILSSIFNTAFQAAPTLLPLIVFKQVALSLRYGNAPQSIYAYATYGLILCGVLENLETGYQFGQLALSLLSRLNAKESKCRTVLIVNVTTHWVEPAKKTLKPFLEAYQSGLETGDLENASFALFLYSFYSYLTGKVLGELEGEMDIYTQTMRQLKHETSLNYQKICWQPVLNLLARSENPCLLVGEAYNEEMMLPLHMAAKDRSAIFNLYFHKLILCYLFGEYSQAVENAAIAEKYLDAVTANLAVTVFHFYDSLAQLAVYNDASASLAERILSKVTTNQQKMKKWADSASMNNLHKFYLVEAERHRVLVNNVEAMELYDRAISLAKENEYLNEEALSNELAAKFYLNWGKEKVAQAYMQEAYYCYARWGALAKIHDLEKRYPQLLASILQAQRYHFQLSDRSSFQHQTIQTTRGSSNISEALDFATILKASLALSSEIQLEQLLCTLMQVVMENAGAKKAALLILQHGNLTVEALATTDEGMTLLSVPCESSQAIPITLVNYVKRTLKTVVLDDATTQTDFIADPYLMQQQPKSVLCAPILHSGKLIGLLYLENPLTIGAFTRDRTEVIQVLCAQAAISLENARLYQQAQDYGQQLERSLDQLKHAQLQMVQNEKMATLGNLVAGVAHEINNPMGFLKGSLNNTEEYIQDLLAHVQCYQQYHPTPPPAVIDHAEKIDLEFLTEDLPKLVSSMKVASERIQDISTSLRTFSRADTAEKVACNLHEGIESTLLILKYRLKASEKRPEIKVIKEYGELPTVKCFLGQLNQVFMNILANAIDVLDTVSLGRTFADIQVNSQQIRISTEVSSDQNRVAIRIKDNGSGMPESIQSRIFDHLFTTKEVGKGTGLGLAIAKSIVEKTHGGKLSCNSALGKGTEFVISLPLEVATEQ